MADGDRPEGVDTAEGLEAFRAEPKREPYMPPKGGGAPVLATPTRLVF